MERLKAEVQEQERAGFYRWVCTHRGWFLLCPVYLADMEEEGACPLPRWPWLMFWLQAMFGVQWCINWVLASLYYEEWVGFWFYGVVALVKPKVIFVRSRN